VGIRPAGIENDGPPNQFDGHRTLPGLISDYSQITQRAGMIRSFSQDLPIEPFGVAQSPILVVLHGQIEGLSNGELGHEVIILYNGFWPTMELGSGLFKVAHYLELGWIAWLRAF